MCPVQFRAFGIEGSVAEVDNIAFAHQGVGASLIVYFFDFLFGAGCIPSDGGVHVFDAADSGEFTEDIRNTVSAQRTRSVGDMHVQMRSI